MPGTDTEVDVCICFSNNCNEGESTDWGIHGLRTPSKVFLPSRISQIMFWPIGYIDWPNKLWGNFKITFIT